MRARAIAPEDAYALALGMERTASAPTHHPYRLFLASEGGTRTIALDTGSHVVIGRHDHCDVVLTDDLGVSLRHVLVRVDALDDGLPVLTILDLDSGSGFELSDGRREKAIVAVGPVVFRVGASTFVALPQGDVRKLPATLEAPSIRHSNAGGYKVNPYAGADYLREASPSRPTAPRITVVPWSVRPSQIFLPSPVSSEVAPASSRAPKGPPVAHEIVLSRDGTSVGIRVSAEELGYGVLLGRDSRCVDGGLQSFLRLYEGVSRVHVLAIQERNGVKLYDLGSTNGVGDERGITVRQITLEDHGTVASLAPRGRAPVSLHWRAVYAEG